MPPSKSVHLSIDLHKTVWWTFLAWIWAFFWRVQAAISRNWSNTVGSVLKLDSSISVTFLQLSLRDVGSSGNERLSCWLFSWMCTTCLPTLGRGCTHSEYVCFSGAMDSHRRSASEGCRLRRSVVFFFHFFYVQAVPPRASGTELWRRMSVQKMLHSRMWTVGTRKRSGTVESSEFGESCEFCTWTLQRLASSWYFEHEPFQAKDRDSLTDWQRAYDNRPRQRADSRLN